MSAPYWGKLPGPKELTTQTIQNRLSDDYASASGEREDHAQARRKSNRISTQTANTDAPTESTLSPFASPTTSSFLGKGLAPRPPSFPYSSPDYPPDIADKRSHRQPRLHEEFDDDVDAGPPPPAAPEAPRAPPVSFRHPFGNGGLPYTHSASAAARRAKQPNPPAGDAMDAEDEYYRRSPRDDRRDYPVLDRGQRTFDSANRQPRPVGEVPVQQVRKGSVKEVNTGRSFPLDARGQPRKASTTSQSDRGKKFADDRSPLQRLELTLDSITKEEKRARVEAAEARVRERAVRDEHLDSPRGAVPQPPRKQPPTLSQPQTQTQQVRFRDRSASAGEGDAQSSRQPEAPIAAHRGPLSQNPPEETARRHYGSGSGHQRSVSATTAAPAPMDGHAGPGKHLGGSTGGANTGIPKRNLSFRERAARNDIKPPNGIENTVPPPAPLHAPRAPPSSGFSLSRTGSNKLKKDPPGDPWYRLRAEADNSRPRVEPGPPRGADVPPPREAPTGRSAVGSLRGKELPPAPPPTDVRRGSVGNRAKFTDAPPEEFGGIRRHATEPLSSGARGPGPGPAARQGPGAGGFEAARRKVRRPNSDDGSESSASEHRHHVSRLLYRHGDLQPGEGLYKPPQFLDEWKQATVGLLGGGLLDLTDDDTPGLEKDKTWWEAGGKRRSISSRPRKAEAFDGEYDESNGMFIFNNCINLIADFGHQLPRDSSPRCTSSAAHFCDIAASAAKVFPRGQRAVPFRSGRSGEGAS